MIARLPRFCGEGERGEGASRGETAGSTQRPAEVTAQFTARFTSLLTLHKLAFLIRETGCAAGEGAWGGGQPVCVLLSNQRLFNGSCRFYFPENLAKPKCCKEEAKKNHQLTSSVLFGICLASVVSNLKTIQAARYGLFFFREVRANMRAMA